MKQKPSPRMPLTSANQEFSLGDKRASLFMNSYSYHRLIKTTKLILALKIMRFLLGDRIR